MSSAVIREQSVLGRAYRPHPRDPSRLHGLDAHDNDFVIGLLGCELHSLSHVIQTMRKTVQTSQYIQRPGPSFIGHALP